MVDNIKLLYKELLIMNTDISSGQGIHWIVFTFGQPNLPQNNFRPYYKIMIVKINNNNL